MLPTPFVSELDCGCEPQLRQSTAMSRKTDSGRHVACGKLGASLASMLFKRNSIEANFLRATLPKERGDDELWVFKRERQQRDIAAAAEGKVTQRQLSWFAGGKARNLKIIGSPY